MKKEIYASPCYGCKGSSVEVRYAFGNTKITRCEFQVPNGQEHNNDVDKMSSNCFALLAFNKFVAKNNLTTGGVTGEQYNNLVNDCFNKKTIM